MVSAQPARDSTFGGGLWQNLNGLGRTWPMSRVTSSSVLEHQWLRHVQNGASYRGRHVTGARHPHISAAVGALDRACLRTLPIAILWNET